MTENVRKSPAFQGLTKQIKERDKQIAELEAKLEAMGGGAAPDSGLAVDAELASQEAFEGEKSRLEQESREAQEGAAFEGFRADFIAAAAGAGMRNPYGIDGAFQAWLNLPPADRGEPAAYLGYLKSLPENAGLFR